MYQESDMGDFMAILQPMAHLAVFHPMKPMLL
jgi:hypothetical protein